MIGPAYARAHPNRVSSIGLLSTAAGRSDDERDKLIALIGKMEREGVASVLDTLLDRWYTDEFLRVRPDVVEQRKQQVIDTPTDVFLSVFRIYATTEMGPWLHEIQTPCLVLTGELDSGCSPRLNHFIAGELGQSELVVLDGLKHSILMEAPDQVASPLKTFLLKHR
jgi:pimeloyl-ACP methyl ester carboxylesterase